MPNEKKTYCNAMWLTEKTFDGGGEVIKVSIKVDKMKQFLDEHVNEKGYVRLDIFRRRERGQNGETHSAQLDTWKPSGDRPKRSAQPEAKAAPTKPSDACPPEDEDVPF